MMHILKSIIFNMIELKYIKIITYMQYFKIFISNGNYDLHS